MWAGQAADLHYTGFLVEDSRRGQAISSRRRRDMNEVSIKSGPSSVNADLTGRSALVTGAASGIGRACAERLSRAGATVTVLDLDGDAATEVAEGIGGEALQAARSEERRVGKEGRSGWSPDH